MTDAARTQTTPEGRVTISVDAMGGDSGPATVVAGCALSAAKNSDIGFLLHGDSQVLEPLLRRNPGLEGRYEVRHADEVVTMDAKPGHVMRHGKATSMWGCIESVRDGSAQAAVSCGNTGALMAVSMLRLRKLPGVERPAIACLWPARGNKEFNTMLDVGADVKADAQSLLQFALMGAAYYRNAFDVARPRVGLLNVGTEDHKGRPEIREAQDLIARMADQGRYDYVGFVEGGDIPGAHVDVIVTDGFTGNVALKTGEGTATLIRDLLRTELSSSIVARFAALLAMNSLKRLQKRIDPRRVNGGVFLGLNGIVVKSHGSADATGVSAAVKLAFRLASSGFEQRMADRLASVAQHVREVPEADHAHDAAPAAAEASNGGQGQA